MMARSPAERLISDTALISPGVLLGDGVQIGPYAVLDPDGAGTVRIGAGTVIGPHTLIEAGVEIGDRCMVDAYCRVCYGSCIGDDTQLLYGAALFEHVRIGRGAIIGSDVSDRTIIEDYVTYFGMIAHSYQQAGDIIAWDSTPQPSPIIRSRAVIGQNALLIGGIEVGEGSYVAAGELVTCNVPAGHMLARGRLRKLSDMRGLFEARTDS